MTDTANQGFSINMRKNGNALKVQSIYLIHGLASEINSGMKMSGKVALVSVARSLGYSGRTKKGALKWAVESAQEGFGYEPTERVLKALS